MTTRAAEADNSFRREIRTSFWSRAWQNHAPGYLLLLPWFIGLLAVGPVLGHASWHAYRAAVDGEPG